VRVGTYVGFRRIEQNPRKRLGCLVNISTEGVAGITSVRTTRTYTLRAMSFNRPPRGTARAKVVCPSCRRDVEVSIASKGRVRLIRLSWLALALVGLIGLVPSLMYVIPKGMDHASLANPAVVIEAAMVIVGLVGWLVYDGLSVPGGRHANHRIFGIGAERPSLRRSGRTGGRPPGTGVGLVESAEQLLGPVAPWVIVGASAAFPVGLLLVVISAILKIGAVVWAARVTLLLAAFLFVVLLVTYLINGLRR
jgi:hypothetical protein